MGSLTRNQLGFLTLESLDCSCMMQIYAELLSCRLLPRYKLLPASKHDLHICIEEKAPLRHQQDLGDLREVVFAGKPHFDGGNALVQPAVIKTHSALAIEARFNGKMAPAHREAGSAGDEIYGG